MAKAPSSQPISVSRSDGADPFIDIRVATPTDVGIQTSGAVSAEGFSGTVADVVRAAAQSYGVNGLNPGGWYKAGGGGAISSTFAPGNAARAIPLILPVEVTIDAFGIAVDADTGVANDDFLVAVYADTGDFYPGAKLHGDFSIDIGLGAANPGEVVLGTPITLGPGVFWLAGVPSPDDGTFTTSSIGGQTPYNIPGDNLSDTVQSAASGWREDTAGAINTLPATWTVTKNAGSNNVLIAFRVEA